MPYQYAGNTYTLVFALPLHDVNSTLDEILVAELVVGGIALIMVGIATWLIVRRGLRPLERMAQTATVIAGGDLSQRVEEDDRESEVGRLGVAFNGMLTQIEGEVAERRASEERLRRFAADASHELRTPLTSIRGYAELFRRGAADRPEDLALTMRRIESEATRMTSLVDDLLLLARLDRNRPLERTPGRRRPPGARRRRRRADHPPRSRVPARRRRRARARRRGAAAPGAAQPDGQRREPYPRGHADRPRGAGASRARR